MKKQVSFLAMLACLTIAGIFSACEKDDSGTTSASVERDMLIGKWHLTLYGYTNPPTFVYEYELNRTLLESGEFIEEFSYDQNTNYTEGTWRLDGNNLILTREGTENVFKVESLSQSAMVVSTTIDASTIAYYKFEKVNTPEPDPTQSAFDENGASKSLFSVSETQKVHFSRGNLQYQASSNTWRFAENQYDYYGEANSSVSSTYSGWIDLFGWGTGNNPTLSSTATNDYMEYHEWGDNAIVNGGNQASMWRTLTYEEWQYLFATRTDATSKYGTAIIDGRYKGLVLLPDDWTLPSDVSFTAGFKDTGTDDDYSQNNYTIAEWQKMEEAGALFFPAAGVREGTAIWNVDVYGLYWSSSSAYEIHCYDLWFSSSIVWPSHDERYLGFSVRLVKD